LLSTWDRLPYDFFITFSTFTAMFVLVCKEHHKEIVYFFIFCCTTWVLQSWAALVEGRLKTFAGGFWVYSKPVFSVRSQEGRVFICKRVIKMQCLSCQHEVWSHL
jgi:hypothetical protein